MTAIHSSKKGGITGLLGVTTMDPSSPSCINMVTDGPESMCERRRNDDGRDGVIVSASFGKEIVLNCIGITEKIENILPQLAHKDSEKCQSFFYEDSVVSKNYSKPLSRIPSSVNLLFPVATVELFNGDPFIRCPLSKHLRVDTRTLPELHMDVLDAATA